MHHSFQRVESRYYMNPFLVYLVLDLICAALWYDGIITTIKLIREIRLKRAETRNKTKEK